MLGVQKSNGGSHKPGKIRDFTRYTREAKFSVAERKKSTGLGFTGSVKEECKRSFTLC